MTSVPIRDRKVEDADIEERPGRDWRDAATSQGMSGAMRSWKR